MVTHLPFVASDHAPLFVQLSPGVAGNPRRRPLRFEEAWLKHTGFQELLSASWRNDISTPKALTGLRETLRRWNREVFGDVKKRKDELISEITKIQEQLDSAPTVALLESEASLLKEFDVVLEQEELIWFQKSREKWIALGAGIPATSILLLLFVGEETALRCLRIMRIYG